MYALDHELNTEELRHRVLRRVLFHPSAEQVRAMLQPLLQHADRSTLIEALAAERSRCSWIDALMTPMLARIFSCMEPIERLTVLERVCLRFREASRAGLGWESFIGLGAHDAKHHVDFWVRAGESGHRRLRHVTELMVFDSCDGLYRLLRLLPQLTMLDIDGAVTEQDCREIHKLHRLSALAINWFATDTTPARLPADFLAPLTKLQGIAVPVFPGWARQLSTFADLRSLQLRQPHSHDLHELAMLPSNVRHQVTNLDLHRLSMSSWTLAADAFPRVESLSISNGGSWCMLTGDAFAVFLRSLRRLNCLTLMSVSLNPALVYSLPASVTALSWHYVDWMASEASGGSPDATTRWLAALGHLRSLETLSLIQCGDLDFSHLPVSALTKLRVLSCQNRTAATWIDLQPLAALPALQELILYDPVRHLDCLGQVRSLQNLSICDDGRQRVVATVPWTQLACLQQLRHLRLHLYWPLTDGDAARTAQATLDDLKCTGTNVVVGGPKANSLLRP